EALDAEQIVASRIVSSGISLCRSRSSNADHRDVPLGPGDGVDRRLVGMAMQHQFGAGFGHGAAEIAGAPEAEARMPGFLVRWMVDEHDPEVAAFAQPAETAGQPRLLVRLEAASRHPGWTRHGTVA